MPFAKGTALRSSSNKKNAFGECVRPTFFPVGNISSLIKLFYFEIIVGSHTIVRNGERSQHRRLPTADHFVALTRWPWAGHRQQPNLVYTELLLRGFEMNTRGGKLQTTPEQMTHPKAYLEGTRALLKQIMFCGVSTGTTAPLL